MSSVSQHSQWLRTAATSHITNKSAACRSVSRSWSALLARTTQPLTPWTLTGLLHLLIQMSQFSFPLQNWEKLQQRDLCRFSSFLFLGLLQQSRSCCLQQSAAKWQHFFLSLGYLLISVAGVTHGFLANHLRKPRLGRSQLKSSRQMGQKASRGAFYGSARESPAPSQKTLNTLT